MSTLNNISKWLYDEVTESSDKKYRHRIIKEHKDKRDIILNELREYIQNAHEDAKRHLRDVAGISLDPLKENKMDPTNGYPELLHIDTLKGYFGEVFSGIVAEKYSPFDIKNWEVPAYLFRFHNTVFQQLEKFKQEGKNAGACPGRTGDDCLAFQRNQDGKIVRSLVCESKCTAKHSTNMISDAHKKIGEKVIIPVDTLRLVEILREYTDDNSQSWVNSLRLLYFGDRPKEYERYDLVCYVCGQSPKGKNKKAWISVNKPHVNYIAKRRLEAVEIHISDIDKMLNEIYRKGSKN